jgi:hypothetical protein
MDEKTENEGIGDLLVQNLGWILAGLLVIYAILFEPLQLSLGLIVFGCSLVATRDASALFDARENRRARRLDDRSRDESTSRRRFVRMIVMATAAVVIGLFLPITIALIGIFAGVVGGAALYLLQKSASG